MPRNPSQTYEPDTAKYLSMREDQQQNQQLDQLQYQRYLPTDLRINVAWPGLSGCLKPDPGVICQGFNGTALQFRSVQAFNVGEKLILDIDLADIQLSELTATVTSSHQVSEGQWSTAVNFCFINKLMRAPSIRCNLLQIADRLRSSADFSTHITERLQRR